MIGHRSDEFEALFARCEEQLRTLFYTAARVFIVAASGSGLQEAAIRNLVSGRVLSFVNGTFSRRWYEAATGCDKQAVRIEIPWNTAVKPAQVEAALSQALAAGPVDAVTVVHNETSTGVISPVQEIAATVRRLSPETSRSWSMPCRRLAACAFATDAWGLDLLLTSSQKALALPPGLAFCAVSDRALAKAATVKGRGWSFDFLKLEKSRLKNTTPATPAISLMRSLGARPHLHRGGRSTLCSPRSPRRSHAGSWAVANGFDLMAEAGYRSPTVTTVTNTRGISIKQLNAHLARHDMEISNGYGDYKDKAFRIAHMGEVQDADLIGSLPR